MVGKRDTGKLRLCFVADLFSIHSRRWIDYFARRGHSILVLSPTDPKMPGVKVWRLWRTPTLPKIIQLLNVFVVMRAIVSFRPHVLHAHYTRIYGWLAAMTLFRPLVITVWGGDILDDQGASSDLFGRKLTPFAIKRARIVTAQSTFLRDRVVSLGQRPDRVKLVGCPGVDRRIFKPGLDTEALRAELGLGNARVVLCPRLIEKLYNTEVIVRAIPEVLRDVAGARFLFTSLAANPAYLNQVKELSQSLGIEKSVVFLDTIPHDRMPLYLNLATVLVSIPDSDAGLPQTVLEAIACGTPFIVSGLPQYHGVLEDNVNALVVNQKSVTAVAAAITRVLKDEPLRRRLAQASLNTTPECMDHEAEMAKMERLYYELSARR